MPYLLVFSGWLRKSKANVVFFRKDSKSALLYIKFLNVARLEAKFL